MKFCASFERCLEGSNEDKWRGNRKKQILQIEKTVKTFLNNEQIQLF